MLKQHMKCPHCGSEHNKYGIKGHIWRAHTVEGKKFNSAQAIRDGNKIHWAKGKTKENNKAIEQQSKTITQRYRNGEIESPFKDKHHSEETKETLRQKRFDYLKDKNNVSTYTNRHKRKLSKGENILYELFKRNGLFDIYEIVNEYPIYPYFIDFAFVNEKVAVEYDGEPHYKNNARLEHDIKKDNFLKTKGWRIYRIPYFELKNFKIEDLIIFINCPVV
jgi:very-short-patch-repair endonuclease